MSKKVGLPINLKMRHDWHYVEELSRAQRSIGRILPIDKLVPNPLQPRSDFGDLTDLTASIKEKGVLEPLLVKPVRANQEWLIIAGERRWRAARLAGLSELPCIELELDDNQVAEIALIENLQRKDLTVWEEADGLFSLSQRFNYTHEDIAQRIGKSRTTVTESLTIANLPTHIRELSIKAGVKTKSAILQIARQFDEEMMLQQIDSLKRHNSVQDFNVDNTDKVADANSVSQSDSFKEETFNSNEGDEIKRKTAESVKTVVVNTNVRHPVRAYNYQPTQGDFKLALKFKKPVDKLQIIKTLKLIIQELEQ